MKLIIEEYGPVIITSIILIGMVVACSTLTTELVEMLNMLEERMTNYDRI